MVSPAKKKKKTDAASARSTSRASISRPTSKAPSRASATCSASAPKPTTKKAPEKQTAATAATKKTTSTARMSPAKGAPRAPVKQPAAQLTPAQQQSQRQRQLQQTFFALAQKEAARALRALQGTQNTTTTTTTAAATEIGSTMTLAEEETGAREEGDFSPLRAQTTSEAQLTLAELFTGSASASMPDSEHHLDDAAPSVLATLWHIPVLTSACAAEGRHDLASPTATTRNLCTVPSPEFPAYVAARVQRCVRNRLRYPWPYQIDPDELPYGGRVPAPLLMMTPSLWHPRSPTTGAAFDLLHMTSSGAATLLGVQDSDDDDDGDVLHGNFFELCGF